MLWREIWFVYCSQILPFLSELKVAYAGWSQDMNGHLKTIQNYDTSLPQKLHTTLFWNDAFCSTLTALWPYDWPQENCSGPPLSSIPLTALHLPPIHQWQSYTYVLKIWRSHTWPAPLLAEHVSRPSMQAMYPCTTWQWPKMTNILCMGQNLLCFATFNMVFTAMKKLSAAFSSAVHTVLR